MGCTLFRGSALEATFSPGSPGAELQSLIDYMVLDLSHAPSEKSRTSIISQVLAALPEKEVVLILDPLFC